MGDAYLHFLRSHPGSAQHSRFCYFEAGLKSNELCVWTVSDPISQRQAEQALRHAIPGFDRYRAAGQIELLAGRKWYLKGDEFDLQRTTCGWDEKLNAPSF
ncbi:MAG: MEDS domain-containing protein [Candidatus Angelobacter sp.]